MGTVLQKPFLDQSRACIIPKLKYEHVHLTSFSKMRVDLAAQVPYNYLNGKAKLFPFQVLSNTVSKGLLHVLGEKAQGTATFVAVFNKFFDCLNVSTFTAGKESQNPDKDPYRSASDPRLVVMVAIYNILQCIIIHS